MPVPGSSPSRRSSADTAPAPATRVRTSPIRNTHGTEANTISDSQPSTLVTGATPKASDPSAAASRTRIVTADHRTGAIVRRCSGFASRQRRSRMPTTASVNTAPVTDTAALRATRSPSFSAMKSGDSGQPSHMRSLKPHRR